MNLSNVFGNTFIKKGGTDLKIRFFICEHCRNTIVMINDAGVPVKCCGENMQEIIPGTSEGAQEKHIPVYDVKGEKVKVSVGEIEHPMSTEHYIDWVCLETEDGFQFKKLNQSMSPHIYFNITKGDKIKAVYAFCNQHSLWKS